jgi:hypothetical protein
MLPSLSLPAGSTAEKVPTMKHIAANCSACSATGKGGRFNRSLCDLSSGGAPLFRQADRAIGKFCSPGGNRHGECTAAERDPPASGRIAHHLPYKPEIAIVRRIEGINIYVIYSPRKPRVNSAYLTHTLIPPHRGFQSPSREDANHVLHYTSEQVRQNNDRMV